MLPGAWALWHGRRDLQLVPGLPQAQWDQRGQQPLEARLAGERSPGPRGGPPGTLPAPLPSPAAAQYTTGGW